MGTLSRAYLPTLALRACTVMPVRVLIWDADADTLAMTQSLLQTSGYAPFACCECTRLEDLLSLVRPRLIVVHGAEDAPEVEPYATLLRCAPRLPIVAWSESDGGYRVQPSAGTFDAAEVWPLGPAIRYALTRSVEAPAPGPEAYF